MCSSPRVDVVNWMEGKIDETEKKVQMDSYFNAAEVEVVNWMEETIAGCVVLGEIRVYCNVLHFSQSHYYWRDLHTIL